MTPRMRRHLFGLLRGASRSYYLPIRVLPRPLRDWTLVAYLLLRVSDCIEDYPLTDRHRRAELLRLWAGGLPDPARLAPLTAAISGWHPTGPAEPMAAELSVLSETHLLISAFRSLPVCVSTAITRRVRAISLAMATRLDRGHELASAAELRAYAYGVSGGVAELLADLFALYSPRIAGRRDRLLRCAPEYGAVLHLANVLAGIGEDNACGAVWIPGEWLAAAGLPPAELAADPASPRASPVLRRLTRMARRHMPGAVAYLAAIPAREYQVRLACAWPLALAAGSLPGSPRRPATAVLVHTALIAWSDRLLARYYAPGGPRGA